MPSKKKDVWTLIIRIVVGLVFIAAGAMKAMTMDFTVQMFGTFGLPALLAYAVTFCELAGGLMVLLGAWPRLAAGVLSIVMIFPTYYSLGMGPVAALPVVLLILLIVILKLGSGRYAVHSR